jgi:hypothetical protein
MTEEKLRLEYIPLSQARRWERNPKRHDIPALVRSIELHGFGDPPKFDSALDAVVYGNGRCEALELMKRDGREPPRGVGVLENGEWILPVVFGVDSESREAAESFGIDHNNTALLGGDLEFTDILRIWDEGALQQVLSEIPDAEGLLATFDKEDLSALLSGPDFAPISAGELPRLDERKPIICPACGIEFQPKK